MILEKNAANSIRSDNLITDKGPIVIGVSGGPDSVALTYALRSINQIEALGCEFYIAHLNHKLRGAESDEDSEYVKQIAHQLDMPVLIKETDIKRVSKESRLSIEEAARIERYSFLKSCANSVGASHVAVAHTADDNIETMLHRIIRGTGIIGLRGIAPKRPISQGSAISLIRPFLRLWKRDILQYLKEKDVTHRTDSSNLQKKHLRNKIRIELIPLLEEAYNNQIKRSLANLCEIFDENNKLIGSLSQSLLNEAVLERNRNKCVLNSKILLRSPEIVQQKAVHDILSNMDVPLKHIGYRKYKEIIKFIKNGKDNEPLHISAGLNICKRDNKLSILILHNNQLPEIKGNGCQKELTKKFDRIELAVPGVTELPLIGSRIEAEIVEYKKGFLDEFKAIKTANEEAVDMAKVDLPLYVRLRMPGDRFRPIGTNGTKKIKDFFIDNKLPKRERDKTPIVMSKHYPVWVAGMRIDERGKISEETKNVIILRYRPIQKLAIVQPFI